MLKSRLFLSFITLFILMTHGCGDSPSSTETGQNDSSISRNEAIATIREELVNSLSENQPIVALASQTAFDSNTQIYQAGDSENASPVLTLSKRSYFIFIDLYPGYMFNHPVIYALVDAETGEIHSAEASGLPVINGETLYPTLRQRLLSDDRFEPDSDEKLLSDIKSPNKLFPKGKVSDNSSGNQSITSQFFQSNPLSSLDNHCKKVAVIWAGHEDQYILNNGTRLASTLDGFGFETHVYNSVDHTFDEALEGYKNVSADLGPCDKFLFYFTGHTADSNDDGEEVEEGDRVNSLTWGLGQGEDIETDVGLENFARNYLNPLSAGKINIVIDACFSGSLIDYLINPLGSAFALDLKPGVELNVFTSSAKDKAAFGAFTFERIVDYFDNDASELTSKYTQDLISELENANVDANGDGEVSVDEFEDAFKEAHNKIEEDLGEGGFDFYDDQEPQSKTFTGEEKTADLETSFKDTPDEPIGVDEEKEVEVSVVNNGPDQAIDPVLMIEFMDGMISQGPESLNCDGLSTYMVSCPLDNISPGSSVNYHFTIVSGTTGELELRASIESLSIDPNESNNLTEVPVIIEGSGDGILAKGLFDFPTDIADPEAIVYAAGSYSQDGYYKARYSSQNDEVSFGDLTGTFITLFAGSNGFTALDLANNHVLMNETGLSGGPYYTIAAASQNPPGSNSSAILMAGGQNGYVIDRFDQTGPIELDGTTYDTYPAGGNPISDVIPFVQPVNGIGFYVYDNAQNLYVPAEVGFDVSLFGNRELISAYIHDDVLSDDPVPQPRGPFLVLTREAESGVYLTKWDGSDPIRAIDNIGYDARRIRCIEDGTDSGNLICAASIFGHDRLGLMTWDGENVPVLTDFAEIGDGPVGIDLRLLPDGNIGIVSTGFNDNTLTETVVATNGRVQSNNTRSVLNGCQSPGHAIYIEDAESLKILGTCYNSNSYFVVESEL